MKIWRILVGEAHSLRRYFLPFLTVSIFILVIFAIALPVNLVKEDGTISGLKIAISFPKEDVQASEMVEMIPENSLIQSIETTEHHEGIAGVESGKWDLYVSLPENFSAALFGKEQGRVTLYAHDPLIGTIVYHVFSETLASLNQMQSYSLTFYHQLLGSQYTTNEIGSIANDFDWSMMTMLLTRKSLLDDYKGIGQYTLQLYSLLLFLFGVICCTLVGYITMMQLKQGLMKKIKFYGYSFWQFIAVKYLITISIFLPGLLIINYFFRHMIKNMSWGALILNSLVWLLLLMVASVSLTFFIGQKGNEHQFLLVVTLFALLLMLVGGLIYPENLSIPSWLKQLNPAYMIQLVLVSSVHHVYLVSLPLTWVAILFSGSLLIWLDWRWKQWHF